MLWLIVILVSLLSGFFLYSKRFTSQLKIFRLQVVQLYYLFLAAPLVYVATINLGIEVYQRPSLRPDSSNLLLFSIFVFFCSISMLGVAIHSTATSLSQTFPKKAYTKAYFINETFHGPLSHDMAFLGALAAFTALSALELNHQGSAQVDKNLALTSGMISGFIFALSVIRSTHIGLSLAGSFFSLLVISFLLLPVGTQIDSYPLATAVLAGMAAIFATLFLTSLIIFLSRDLTKKLIAAIFPQGHPIHESFHLY